MQTNDRFALVVAVHVLLRRENEVLLLRRSNTGYEDGKMSLVAGHLDGGETVLEAAVREVSEEAGVAVDVADLRVVHVAHRWAGHERIDFFLETYRWVGEPGNAEPHKCSELVWCPVDDLPSDTIGYISTAMEHIQAGTSFSVIGWDQVYPVRAASPRDDVAE